MGKRTEVILPADISELRYVNLPEKEKIQKAKEDVITRVLRKAMMNPFIPIGIVSTSVIIVLGLRQFVLRNTVKQQFYMRARVASQFLTFASFFAGTVYYHYRNKEKKEKKEIDYDQF